MPELKRFGDLLFQVNGKKTSDVTVFSGLFYSLLKISLSEAFKGLKAIRHRSPSG